MAVKKNVAKEVKAEAPKAEIKAEAPKTEVKAEAPKTEKKAAAPKAEKKAAAPKAEKKVAAPKAEKKAAVPKAEKKAAAPKTAKKTTVAASVTIQFGGKEFSQADLVKIAQDVWVFDMNKKAEDFKQVEFYVKPEEGKVYFVVNGKENGSFSI